MVGWLGLLGVALLSIGSTVPLGAVVGSLVKSPLAVFPMSLVASGHLLISGIFFPIETMPEWLAGIAKAFPVYWLGLLSRGVLVPESEAVVGWELAFALGLPAAWAVFRAASRSPRAPIHDTTSVGGQTGRGQEAA